MPPLATGKAGAAPLRRPRLPASNPDAHPQRISGLAPSRHPIQSRLGVPAPRPVPRTDVNWRGARYGRETVRGRAHARCRDTPHPPPAPTPPRTPDRFLSGPSAGWAAASGVARVVRGSWSGRAIRAAVRVGPPERGYLVRGLVPPPSPHTTAPAHWPGQARVTRCGPAGEAVSQWLPASCESFHGKNGKRDSV